MIHDDPARDDPFVSRGLHVKVPFQKADRIVHGFITREEGGVP